MKTVLIEIMEIPSSKKDLKKFGLTMGVFFAGLAGYWLWRAKAHPEYFLWASIFFLSGALLFPLALKPLQKIWMGLAVVMGWFMSRLILSLLFFGILTPIALILRLSGKELLDKKWKEKKDTFWINRVINRPKESYEKQF